jgi:hypothetical protein
VWPPTAETFSVAPQGQPELCRRQAFRFEWVALGWPTFQNQRPAGLLGILVPATHGHVKGWNEEQRYDDRS